MPSVLYNYTLIIIGERYRCDVIKKTESMEVINNIIIIYLSYDCIFILCSYTPMKYHLVICFKITFREGR